MKLSVLQRVFFSNDHKNCSLSVLWRCPFYREFHYSKFYTKMTGACEKCPFYGGVRLTEVSVSRELTVLGLKVWEKVQCVALLMSPLFSLNESVEETWIKPHVSIRSLIGSYMQVPFSWALFMHSVPVPGPLALIRQNQQQTPAVESLQNTKYCKLAVTDVLRLDCSRKCLTSQEH